MCELNSTQLLSLQKYRSMSIVDYASKKVKELQSILQERGLSVTGKKVDLIRRLRKDDKRCASLEPPTKQQRVEDDTGTSSHADTTDVNPAVGGEIEHSMEGGGEHAGSEGLGHAATEGVEHAANEHKADGHASECKVGEHMVAEHAASDHTGEHTGDHTGDHTDEHTTTKDAEHTATGTVAAGEGIVSHGGEEDAMLESTTAPEGLHTYKIHRPDGETIIETGSFEDGTTHTQVYRELSYSSSGLNASGTGDDAYGGSSTVDSDTHGKANACSDTTSQPAPSNVVHLQGFVRPLNIPKLEHLLRSFGSIHRWYLHDFRTECAALFYNISDALSCFHELNGMRYPDDSRQPLVASFLQESFFDTIPAHTQSHDSLTAISQHYTTHDGNASQN
uniref:Apoptotic chromatin condensation inducer in the nucleus n=2 Tax=Lygus hesperus TaxID=30085 RepID=A0A0A9YQW3_LYGHE